MTQTPDKIAKTGSQASIRDVSFDELLDDTIGLSFKSVKSIWLLFKDPLKYFAAAKTPFWQNSFSPSFRIYAGLMALSAAMKFIYRDESSPMVQVYIQQFELIKKDPHMAEDLANADTTAMAITTLKWYLLITPIASIIAFSFLGLVYLGFGEKLNPVVRIRYIFAAMIPATVVGFFLIIPMYLFPEGLTAFVSFVSIAIMLGMCWITVYKGAFPNVTTQSGKIGRATALSVLIILFMLITTIIAIVIGVAFAMKEALSAGAVS